MTYYLGLILVLTSWAGGVILLSKWSNKDFATISKHAASSPWAHALFASVLVVGGSLFYVWLLKYLVPNVLYAPLFIVLLSLAILLQSITAIIPDIPGWKRTVHRYAAWGMALSWLPLVALLTASSGLSQAARAINAVSCIYMIAMLIFVAGLHKGKFLIYQTFYVVTFQLALLVAVYL